MNAQADRPDVAIVGGGLSGLTLALQLRQAMPDLDIAVVERNAHPVPLAAHKVGESTVEMGAHYLANVIGLKDHLQRDHLRKNGLRFFFGANGRPLDRADEIGVSRLLRIPSYQIDRGLLENELGRRVRAAGVRFMDATRVTRVSPGDDRHGLDYRNDERDGRLQPLWLIDAASRASPLKRHLGLARPVEHDVHAAWFRVEGDIDIGDWSSDAEWGSRSLDLPRRHSTNHLMGPGYWVWLIPLSSGATSVGIVADARLHRLEDYNRPDLARAWLSRFEPGCAEALDGAPVMDFKFLRHYAHDAGQLFSSDRWALTGEAGVFLDPFYSPGTDFIGISNTMITELVKQDRCGGALRRDCLAFEYIYRSFFRSSMALYQGMYPGFGDRHLMALKTTWDYCYYWGVLALLFFNEAMTGLHRDADLPARLGKVADINLALQARFRRRAAKAIHTAGSGLFIDQCRIPIMTRLNAALATPLQSAELGIALRDNAAALECLAGRLGRRLEQPDAAIDDWEREHLGDLPERLQA